MESVLFENMREQDTAALGKKLAAALFDGAFLALWGDLGAGKTTLVRAIAEGLGIRGVVSPTFTISREYEGRLPLAHFDAYRLTCAQELYDIGFADTLARGGVVVMEWCENVAGALPEERLDIRISGSGDAPRTVELAAHGARHEALLEAIV